MDIDEPKLDQVVLALFQLNWLMAREDVLGKVFPGV